MPSVDGSDRLYADYVQLNGAFSRAGDDRLLFTQGGATGYPLPRRGLWSSVVLGNVVFQRGNLPTGTNPVLIPGTENVANSFFLSTLVATPQTLWGYTLADNSIVSVRVMISASRAGGADRATYQLMAAAYRTGGGSATLLGATTVVKENESDVAWDADFDVTGNDIRLRVTGGAYLVDWVAVVEAVTAP